MNIEGFSLSRCQQPSQPRQDCSLLIILSASPMEVSGCLDCKDQLPGPRLLLVATEEAAKGFRPPTYRGQVSCPTYLQLKPRAVSDRVPRPTTTHYSQPSLHRTRKIRTIPHTTYGLTYSKTKTKLRGTSSQIYLEPQHALPTYNPSAPRPLLVVVATYIHTAPRSYKLQQSHNKPPPTTHLLISQPYSTAYFYKPTPPSVGLILLRS